MQNTANYQLKKPEGTDIVNIQDFNDNADIIDMALANKVEKISGKQLSTNDYTTAEKTKLAGIEAGAQVNAVTSIAGKTGAVTLFGTDVPAATISARGTVQLNNTLTSTSTTNALTAAQGKILKDLVETKVNSADFTALNQAITQHMNETNNPHNVTKTQVGLNNVENYSVATQAEAEVGTVTNKYMTPLRTKQALEKILNLHTNDSNLHITAAERAKWDSSLINRGDVPSSNWSTLEAGIYVVGGINIDSWISANAFHYGILVVVGTPARGYSQTYYPHHHAIAFTRNGGWGSGMNAWKRVLSQDDYDTLFQSVSNGKALVADAITGKGVTTSPTAEFATMATNISRISSGKGYAEGTYTSTSSPQTIAVGFDAGVVIVSGAGINMLKVVSNSISGYMSGKGMYMVDGTNIYNISGQAYNVTRNTTSKTITISGLLSGNSIKWQAFEAS